MSAPYIIPFNHQPILTGAGTSTYTVPSGKYTRLTITLNTSLYFSASTNGNIGNFPPNGNTACDSVVVSIWAKAGDVITFSSTNPAAASAAGTGGTVAFISGTSTMIALLNGTAFAKASASATFFTSNNLSSTVTSEALSGANYYFEEYNVIS